MSKPKILFVDHAGVLGGAELCLLDVVRPYRETSRVILFESGPFQEQLQQVGIPVEVRPAPSSFLDVKKSAGWWGAMHAIPGLAKLTWEVAREARSYDVVFANSQKALLVAGPASTLARRPVIWNLHDMLTTDHFSRLSQQVAVRWANVFVDQIIANSRATRSAFGRSGGKTEKTTVVYNGIDAAPFDNVDHSDLALVRDELNVSEAPLLGVFSRLAPWKGQHILLKALPDLPDVQVLFVGDTLFHEDEPYEQTLRRSARRLGVADRVHFLGFRRDVPRLMTLVDVVVHTSVDPEPFGRVIVEGMLAGTPVIATSAGGAQEIVQEHETGVLVPPQDPDALRKAVQRLLSNQDGARSMAEAAQSYARRRFSVERMQKNVQDVVRDVCDV